MIKIDDKKVCCGCNACGDVCSVQAITFKRDEEGFAYPLVDEGKCIQCGLCEKMCPVLQIGALRSRSQDVRPSAYAAISKNIETRYDSTSGGLFSELANAVFADGGYVGGAVWNEDFTISQIVSENKDDLPRLRSSKYAQSDAQGFYKAVKAAVKTGRPVLVCGTPCQMAAVRLVFGEKTPENLYIVDFICRGSNSPLILRKYIDSMERKHGVRVTAIKMKSKELGWRRLTTKFAFADGSVEYDPKERSLYMQGYLHSNAFCRESCYSCKFKGFPRLADVSLGDCWHVADALQESFDDDGGTSVVLCNTEKGEALLKKIEAGINRQSVDLDEVLKGNRMLIEPLPQPKVSRGDFYASIREKGFEATMEALIGKEIPLVRSTLGKIKFAIRRVIQNRGKLLPYIRANGLRAFLSDEKLMIPEGKVCLEKSADAVVCLSGNMTLGSSPYRTAHAESRLLMRSASSLISAEAELGHGFDIQLFKGARLEIGENFYSNLGLEISCAKSIKIGRDVLMGRHVSIRDTNGGHTIASTTFTKTAPVIIEDHVWLCDGSSVMPGVKIGAGSVVAAKAVVVEDVPANCLVAGIPAKVVKTNVVWKI